MGSRHQRTVRMEKLHKGFRFRPTDEELVDYYLRLKIDGRHSAVSVIPEIDILKWEPWDLPALSVVKSDDPEWLYFWARDKKYPTSGYRSNRATGAGYWKATGKDRPIKSHKACSSSSQIIGLKKTLVFYMGRAPRGERTNWVMHEYRRTEPDLEASALAQVEYVLCRLFHKADERLDNSKPNEVECNESLPSDDISTDVVEEAGDIQVVKEAEGWTDQADDIAFDGIDHSGEETATEVTPLDNEGTLTYSHTYQESLPSKEISISKEFGAYNEFDDKAFYDLSYYDFEPFLCSPFAADFGNESNELHFQDGTFELDPSLSDLLQSLQNQDPTGEYNACETFIPSSVDASEQAPITTMCEAPISTSDYAIEEDYFVNEPIEMPYHPNSIKDDTCPITDTGIKIRSHEPRDQSNSTVQGTAPRRIHLSMGSKPKSINRDISEGEKHASSPPLVPKMQESHDADGTASEDLESAEKNDSTSVKKGQNGGTKPAPCVLSAGVPGGKGSGPLKVNPASIYLAMILSVVFFGVWICPRFQPQYG